MEAAATLAAPRSPDGAAARSRATPLEPSKKDGSQTEKLPGLGHMISCRLGFRIL